MTNSICFHGRTLGSLLVQYVFPEVFIQLNLNLLVQAQDISRLFTSLMSIFLSIKTSVYTDSYKTSFCTATVMRKNKKEGTIVNRWHSLFTNQTQTQTETQTNSYKFALLLCKYCVKL